MYGVRVRSISLGGTGRFSELQYLEVNNVDETFFIAEIIILSFVLIILFAVGLFYGMKLWPLDFTCHPMDLCRRIRHPNDDDRNLLLQSIVQSGFDEVAWSAEEDIELRPMRSIPNFRMVEPLPNISSNTAGLAINEGASASSQSGTKVSGDSSSKNQFFPVATSRLKNKNSSSTTDTID